MTTTEQHPETFDAAAAEQFAGRMLNTLNEAGLALMTSIGHQTGLFDSLARLGEPATSARLAEQAGLDERYVREWLGAMTTAGVVRFDPVTSSYALPAEHAAFLTEAAGPDNLARLTQYIPLLGEVEQPIIACFRNGGGLSYAQYPRFHAVMAEDSREVLDAALLDSILPVVPGGAERLAAGADLADIGCGRGHAVNLLAKAFPRSRFVGYDFSAEALEAARVEAAELGLDNATFELQDVAELDVRDAFDIVTAIDAVHDQAQPAAVLRNAAAALRPGGTFLMVDVKASSRVEENLDNPLGVFFYAISTMHCMTVSLGLGGAGLGTMWGRQLAERMLGEAGFTSVSAVELEQDPFNYYYVATKA